ncbi:MAG: hypothetical protein M3Z26_09760 [Bacteroidota bacterium]|nr:hypothetical protein [Bacteroidota bacterium]
MQSNLDDFDLEPEKRSSFLTALCILTFIGSGWAIISSIWTYATASQASQMLSQTKTERRDSVLQDDSVHLNLSHRDSSRKSKRMFGGKMGVTFSKMFTEENLHKSAIGNLVSAILTLMGALLMWRLIRKGFYLYISGIVIGIIVPFYLYGNNLIAVGISSFTSFFGLVFIALYALNLKSMKGQTTEVQKDIIN